MAKKNTEIIFAIIRARLCKCCDSVDIFIGAGKVKTLNQRLSTHNKALYFILLSNHFCTRLTNDISLPICPVLFNQLLCMLGML